MVLNKKEQPGGRFNSLFVNYFRRNRNNPEVRIEMVS
ncbi:hypothetical protein J2Y45_002465 [Dyadobacter sp. BE34]|uniref:Uncharacterized protein n=1 Tax=Dyadobacter fermentans TaxID=94254 RepID=A0ABU1QVN6_9BACT|nr:hypothetical protein [Dyadobacter fermentans]MDR7043014.1 hypothetical protein [Dyadobacter sp. BE242]MDR7197326.1 hypothetical protein [Dyadobacter sp. BE34]MDR7215239.1 hypothetical protein [Dyadobacter sp. BE31]MDR7262775.1 hypothetical protein [Dyadobacter sp. BE32]